MARHIPHVVIIQNYLSEETGGKQMLNNLSKLVLASQPNAEIEVCVPIQGDPFPRLDQCDLIILTGGPFDLLTEEKPPWVVNTLAFLGTAASVSTSSATKKPKLIGICWGQQAIALALGGSVEKLSMGSRVGVESIQLTPSGVEFFNTTSLSIHKRHDLVVSDIGPHLSCLAHNNEILISKDQMILTLQGHPELDAELSSLFAPADEPGCSFSAQTDNGGGGIEPIDRPHDGHAIFATLMEWALGDRRRVQL